MLDLLGATASRNAVGRIGMSTINLPSRPRSVRAVPNPVRNEPTCKSDKRNFWSICRKSRHICGGVTEVGVRLCSRDAYREGSRVDLLNGTILNRFRRWHERLQDELSIRGPARDAAPSDGQGLSGITRALATGC
jgi:hypothetical protein